MDELSCKLTIINPIRPFWSKMLINTTSYKCQLKRIGILNHQFLQIKGHPTGFWSIQMKQNTHKQIIPIYARFKKFHRIIRIESLNKSKKPKFQDSFQVTILKEEKVSTLFQIPLNKVELLDNSQTSLRMLSLVWCI